MTPGKSAQDGNDQTNGIVLDIEDRVHAVAEERKEGDGEGNAGARWPSRREGVR